MICTCVLKFLSAAESPDAADSFDSGIFARLDIDIAVTDHERAVFFIGEHRKNFV